MQVLKNEHGQLIYSPSPIDFGLKNWQDALKGILSIGHTQVLLLQIIHSTIKLKDDLNPNHTLLS